MTAKRTKPGVLDFLKACFFFRIGELVIAITKW